MKKIFWHISLLLGFLFVSVYLFAQVNINSIKSSLETGNVNSLSQYFANSLELTLLDIEDTYNKSDAITQLEAFFASHQPNGFNIKHQGDAPGGAKFLMGTLRTSKGSFDAYLVIKGGTIQEFSIEK